MLRRRISTATLIVINLAGVWLLAGLSLIARVDCANARDAFSDFLPRLCYTDLRVMWTKRDLDLHLFPYIFGVFTEPNHLSKGSVEYPVFSGLVMWLTALPVDNYRNFLIISTIVAVVAASVVAILLVMLVGHWSLVWSFSPLVFLYLNYNWDVYPILAVVLGVWFMVRGPRRWSPRARLYWAAGLFAVGGLLKLWPAIFLLPLALYAALIFESERRRRIWEAVRVLGLGAVIGVLGNLPFALLGFNGWMSSFAFQRYRTISSGTISIWYWWMLPLHPRAGWVSTGLTVMTVVAALATAIGFAYALWFGWKRYLVSGTYPWLPVAAAMLVAFMALGKVNSLQYAIWLVPLVALLTIRVREIVALTVANVLLFSVWFMPNALFHVVSQRAATLGVMTVYVILLAYLFFRFLRSDIRVREQFVPSLRWLRPAKAGAE